MRKLSRRQKENQIKTKNVTFPSVEEAIEILKQTSTANFVETVELHANLNIDPKYANQQLRTTVSLPNGVGTQIWLCGCPSHGRFARPRCRPGWSRALQQIPFQPAG